MHDPPGLRILPIALILVSTLWISMECVDRFASSSEISFEQQVLRWLRRTDDPARMKGPPALEEAMRDFTALGGYAVLLTVTISFAVFLRAELAREVFYFFWSTVVSGFLIGLAAKYLVQRTRPTLVPHLSHVSGHTSFPSSHAMMAVIVFVTIALLLAQLSRSKPLQHGMLGLSLAIAFLVGVSRVCMGVHFPTDVLGGWTIGLFWTWSAFRVRSNWLQKNHAACRDEPN